MPETTVGSLHTCLSHFFFRLNTHGLHVPVFPTLRCSHVTQFGPMESELLCKPF